MIHGPSNVKYIHTYIPWIHKCGIKTVGCETSYKYTNIQIYSVKHYKHLKHGTVNHLYNYKIHLQSKRSVYVGVFLRLLQILPVILEDCYATW